MSFIKFNKLWFVLILIAAIFSALYLYYTLFPGNISHEVYRHFSPLEISKAQKYHRINRLIYITSFLTKASFLIWFVFGNNALKLSHYIENTASGKYYLNVFLYFIALWVIVRLISLPFSLLSHSVQVEWGFSVQTMASWWSDYFKSATLDFVFSAVGVLLFFVAINSWPKTWWIKATIFLTIIMFVQIFVYPTFIAPLFNNFTPIHDPKIINMVKEISKNAGIKIDRIQEMDASKRTTLANAYFYGFGNTSRIVLYDTLLKHYPDDEIKAVIAHEAGHWKENHVLKGMIIGILGLILGLYLLNILIYSSVLITYGKRMTPAVMAMIYLFVLLINFDTNPIQNYISRQMEKQADLLSVKYIHDKNAVIKLQIELAKKSLLDVDPPPFIEWFSYSHPSTMHRIELVQKANVK
ncbi:Zn-dependent protease with chaperone function [Thermoanaerobacter kivui]|uniref:Zn-dependent protease with chaperone function n=1 Tax=Thermoanaerobacter kivui TaxID=2325 RepID=A0A097AQX7_THEKI|nr:M48 family metallopeptidase [Thermoanaerobacter kivui]AIS52219.1 Zn-dependent protease with chaperone function [Thermoanaerobacter kivui]